MNATKFVVLLIFVAVVCANVGARQLDEVSVNTGAYNSEYTNSNSGSPGGPTASASGSVYKSTSGYVTAEGPTASANSGSSAYGDTGSSSAAGPNAAVGNAYSYGSAGSGASGTTGSP